MGKKISNLKASTCRVITWVRICINLGKRVKSESLPDSDLSLFPKSIELESIEDTLIIKLSSFIIEKTLHSNKIHKSVKKLINNTLQVEVPKKTSSHLLLELKYFYNLYIKAYHYNSLNSIKECCEKSRSHPLHHIWNKN